jgi:TetR/AcrR family transcriptional repressor of nem operon
MPRDGSATRTRLLDAAEALVLERGLAGTSVDDVLTQAGSTKGAFFHHFASKGDLGRALVERWAQADGDHLERTMARAEALADDPLQRLLVFAGLLVEEAGGFSHDDVGCLFASFLYERQMVDEATREVIAASMRLWRDRVAALIDEAAKAHPPDAPLDAPALADELLVAYEGAFVLSRALDDPGLVARQLHQYREHLRLLFGA